MADLPVNDPLSGPPAPPFLGPSVPPPGGQLVIYSSAISTASGQRTIGPLITALSQTPANEGLDLDFTAASDETFTVPVNATYMVIVPPVANTVALTLKGAAGDTGIPLAPAAPSAVSAVAGSPVVITSAGAITGAVQVTFA